MHVRYFFFMKKNSFFNLIYPGTGNSRVAYKRITEHTTYQKVNVFIFKQITEIRHSSDFSPTDNKSAMPRLRKRLDFLNSSLEQ